MKKIAKVCLAVLSLSALTSAAHAANPGAYLGLGLGASKQETPNQFLIKDRSGLLSQSRDIGGLGGRAFGGYNFNNYVGIETGLAGYAQSKYTTKLNLGSLNLANANLKYNMAAWDVVAKGYIPFADSGFNLYGLGGAALVHTKVEAGFTSSLPMVQRMVNEKGSETHNTVRPIVGVGASYDIPQTQLTTSLEYSHIIGRGDVKKSVSAIPSADMLTLNIAYNFG